MQESEKLEAILADIRSALERCEGQSKTGAQIHQIIAEAAPDLDIRSLVEIPAGPGALTKFIETYLDETVKRMGRQGGDVLYQIGNRIAPLPQMHDPNIWRAFVSPNAVNHLCLQMPDMRLITAESLDLDGDVRHIERVTEDEHDAIRQGFLSGLSEGQRGLIDPGTSQASPYEEFVQTLRSGGLMRQWGRYRRDAFQKLLAERLEQISIAREYIPSILNQLMASQKALFKQEENKSQHELSLQIERSRQDRNHESHRDVDFARLLARSVIDHMGHNEIRAIHLPFGALLDALNARK